MWPTREPTPPRWKPCSLRRLRPNGGGCWTPRRALFGRGQIIVRDRESGVLWGGSDPRADGLAMALG